MFGDDEDINSIINKLGVSRSMFLTWMEANRKYSKARELTYAEFPTKFVYKLDLCEWTPKKHGFSIRRVFYVSPDSGEI